MKPYTLPEMKNLTKKQLFKACQNHRFLILRFSYDNSVMAVNTRIAKLKRFAGVEEENRETNFISLNPCSFHEYINLKKPFC